ncbi:MAG: preprotein translocase subunit SecA [Chloroflexales bacterium]|nr:preprotein translocase subunit SecA [Chloroflexales bacterium]
MLNWLKKLVGDENSKALRQIEPIVDEINAHEAEYQSLNTEALRAKTDEFRQRFREMTESDIAEIDDQYADQNLNDSMIYRAYQQKRREVEDDALDELLPEAFAIVREAAQRILGMRHYDVQMIGGIVLHQGKIAEMKTGEGKTLVATLPLYLNAIAGRGCHLVTVNDYLAKVGAGWMGPLYHALGLQVGFIAHEYSALYDADFVDPKANPEDQRLVHWRPCARREAYAANITYGTNNEFGFDYLRDNMAIEKSQMVQQTLHFAIVDEVDNILIDEARTPLIISGPSQKSSDQYKRVARLVPNLRPSTITPKQAKEEGLEPDGDFMIEARSKSISLTDQGIERLERMLNIPEGESLYDPQYYELTHFVDNALKAQFIFHRDKDYMINRDGEIVIIDEFTGRAMPGRRWSDGLHQAVEAKEGVPIKNENVTMATITFQNYFRMYAKLAGMTGTAYTEREEFGKIYNLEVIAIPTHKPMVRQDLADQIYRNENAKFTAVVREVQEMNQQGRPVLIGTTSVETSEQLSEMLKRTKLNHAVLNAKQHEREAGIVAQAGRKGAITVATNMAGRGTDILLGGNPDGLIDDILSQQGIKFEEATPEQKQAAFETARQLTEKERADIIELGGLHIVGTERHEARRIDNQLRGRAGRQGDPGSSRFYLSLEDELMRRFGPMERIKNIMSRLGVEDDVPIEAGLLDKSIEGAQSRVEGYNFDIRKHTVEFDDVMNRQRQIIYSDRRAILDGQDMRSRVLELIGEEIAALIDEQLPEGEPDLWDIDAVLRAIRTINPMLPATLTADELDNKSRAEIEDQFVELVEEAYEERERTIGAEQMRFVERRMMLAAIDRQWVDYLTAMDDLRQAINLQAIAQRDPLVEFKRRSFAMFDELKVNITRDMVFHIIPASFQYEAYLRQIEAEQQQRLAAAQRAGGSSEEQARDSRTVRKIAQMPGRNDPCPCGSGKKFKYCHLGHEQEILHLIQAGGSAAPAPKTVSAQIATGRVDNKGNGGGIAAEAEAIRQATSAHPTAQAPRGRAAPPAPRANTSNAGKNKGKGQPTKKK